MPSVLLCYWGQSSTHCISFEEKENIYSTIISSLSHTHAPGLQHSLVADGIYSISEYIHLFVCLFLLCLTHVAGSLCNLGNNQANILVSLFILAHRPTVIQCMLIEKSNQQQQRVVTTLAKNFVINS